MDLIMTTGANTTAALEARLNIIPKDLKIERLAIIERTTRKLLDHRETDDVIRYAIDVIFANGSTFKSYELRK